MAALRTKENPSGQLVLEPTVSSRLGSLASVIGWLVILGVFFLPELADGRMDWPTLWLIIFFLLVTVGGAVLSSLLATQVIVDPSSRVLSINQRLLVFPIRSTVVPFADLANVEYQYYRQSSGRTAHDAWRVNAISKEGRRIALNWDGNRDEMSGLAQRVASLARVEVLDHSVKPVSTVQQILDSLQGRTEKDSGDGAAPGEPGPAPMADQTLALDNPMPDEPKPMRTPETPDSSDSIGTAPIPFTVTETETLTGAGVSAGEPKAETLRRLTRQELEQRIAKDPMDSEARYALGRQYQESNQLDQAIQLYQETLRIDTSNAEAQNDLGVALWQRGKRAEAEAAFRRAIALDPFSSTAHLNLGLVLRSSKRAAEASQEFYQARQNARGPGQSRIAEAASTGDKVELQLSDLTR